MRTDYNVKMNGAFGLFGNITSTVTHVGKYMWIINKLWAGVDQCICTDPGRLHVVSGWGPRFVEFCRAASGEAQLIVRSFGCPLTRPSIQTRAPK